jgi:hypothetical protein
MTIRINQKTEPTKHYTHTPQYIFEDFAKIGSQHPTNSAWRFNGEIAEILVWNVSLDDKNLEIEENKLKQRYECSRTSFKWKA